jgi:transcriptional regulator with XRE-family HTH domain
MKRTPNVAMKSALFATGKRQDRIAKQARIHPAKLSHVLYGRRELDPDELARLAKVLGKHPSELFDTVSA